MNTTLTEENYLKAIFHLSQKKDGEVSTNAIAQQVNSKASSVTDMLKKLSDKDLISYVKYKGVRLTEKGRLTAVDIIRRHRLWEVFLVEKLNFSWDEVHEVAEELEHINSDKLIDELDAFLDHPTQDPHGDPIPDKFGNFQTIDKILLSQADIGKTYKCIGVKDTSSNFLQYLDNNNIGLGMSIEVLHKEPFDNSITIRLKNKEKTVSQNVAKSLYLIEL